MKEEIYKSVDKLIKSIDERSNFPEDYEEENGIYINICIMCGEDFIGHKRRQTCKLCVDKQSKKISSNQCLVFLDFDGVLNCQVFYEKNKDKRAKDLYTERIEMLNEFCKDVKAKVVISSSWRIGHSTRELQGILDKHGANFEVIGKTKSSNHRIRGVEIRQWIEENV